MDYEKVVESVVCEEAPQGLDYQRMVLYKTREGNWLYAGYRGPKSRYICLVDSGGDKDNPDLFLITPSEAFRLLEDFENGDELIKEYFPECSMSG